MLEALLRQMVAWPVPARVLVPLMRAACWPSWQIDKLRYRLFHREAP